MTRRRSDRLSSAAEQLALALLFEATNGKLGRDRPLPEGTEKKEINVSFQDRRALLDSIVKLIEKRHKMKPEDDEPDGIAQYRSALNGSLGGESGDGGDTSETASGDDAEA